MAPDPAEDYRSRLIDAGHLIETGVAGLYGRGGGFESVVGGLERLVQDAGAGQPAETRRFPPVLPRPVF
ncbi:MAG TPA: hypothetical protein VKI19_06115, partial [Acidimicrobiales bacterium]|nr:hypothetical protein [Acidimicrobiales bacterium]